MTDYPHFIALLARANPRFRPLDGAFLVALNDGGLDLSGLVVNVKQHNETYRPVRLIKRVEEYESVTRPALYQKVDVNSRDAATRAADPTRVAERAGTL